MTFAPRDMLVAAGLTVGFAAVGETVLRRSSRQLAEWNASLVVGMGVCAAILFPISLLSPQHAVDEILGVMAACVLLAAWKQLHRSARRPAPKKVPRDVVLPLTLAGTAFLAFAALDFRFSFLWDGFAIWASKAQRLFIHGGMEPGWYGGGSSDPRLVLYPPLVPLIEALEGRLRGRFDFDGLKPIFLIFAVSMAISVFAAVRARADARLAAWGAAIVLLVPALSTGAAAGGYADMPQAAIVASVAAAGMRRDGEALPWLIGALTTVKPEGVVLALLAGGAALLARPRAARLAKPIAIVTVFFAIRIAYARWTGAEDNTYAFRSLALSASRVPTVARLAVGELLNPIGWGLMWPAFVVAVWILLRHGAREERVLVGATATSIVLMAGPFLFTTWPLEVHFAQAYFRLLAQLAPAAVVGVMLAYARARESVDRLPLSPRESRA